MPMHTSFVIVAMLMTLVAFALVLVPLLREKFVAERRLGETRRYAALILSMVVPVIAFGVYHWVAKPQGSASLAATAGGHTGMAGDSDEAGAPMPVDHGGDMQAAVARLAGKLRQHPDDPEAWALLGRTYKATQHYAEAREAFKNALDAAPNDAGLEREYAAAGTPTDDGTIGPQQCPVSAAAGECNEPSAAPGDATRLVVNVALDPKFKDSVGPNDALFVFAKATHGPPMPLAIARLTVAQLPARTLSASMTTAQAEPVRLTIAEILD
jgi:hypothetical protein